MASVSFFKTTRKLIYIHQNVEMADEDLIDYDEEEETVTKDAEGAGSKK